MGQQQWKIAVVTMALWVLWPNGSVQAQLPKPSADPPGTALPEEAVRDAEQYANQAGEHFDAGRFAEAVSAYLKAYRLSPTAALLYNIAFIYDHKLSENDLAIDFYRRYIRSADAEPDLVQRSTERLRELGEVQQQRSAAHAAGAGGNDTAGPGGVRTGVVADAPVRHAGLHPWSLGGWISLGGGTALLATGITLGFLARETHKDFQASRALAHKQDLRDRGRAMAMAGDILMSVGAGGIVTGVVLLLLAPKTTATPSAPQVGLAPQADGALLWLGGSF